MATESPPTVHLETLIQDSPIRPFHFLVLALTGSVMFLDGVDTQTISFIAPVVAREWGLPVSALGPIFSASIVGLMIGYLALSPLANRIGHRKLIISATLLFGVFTALCALANSDLQLITLRFLTGIGLGAAIPSTVALASEFAPARHRSSFIMAIYCCLAAGFVAASLLSGAVIPLLGWRTIFLIGGALPVVLVVVLLRLLPDSPSYLLSRGNSPARLHSTLRRLNPGVQSDELTRLRAGQEASPRGPILQILSRQWLFSTLLLWVAFMINLGVFYAILSWLPTILGKLGHRGGVAIAATALITVGGIVGATIIGPAMDRCGPFGTLGLTYLIGSIFVAGLAVALTGDTTALLAAAVLAGVCVTGGQMSVIALAARLYPLHIRSTGVGWALGIGRVGGVVAPLLVGHALGTSLTPRQIFLVMAASLVLAGVCVLVLSRVTRRQTGLATDSSL